MKDKIIHWLKLFLLIWPAVMGYSFVFLRAWVRLDLPLGWWSMTLASILAVLVEWLFLKWVGR